MMDRRTAVIGIGASLICSAGAKAAPPLRASVYRRIAQEADDNLRRQDITLWFPRAIDAERGGYHQNYAEDWSFISKGDRAAVYQARLTWLSAQAVSRYPEEAKLWTERSNHGLAYLADHLWDAEHGGFYWGLEATAPYPAERGGEKHLYGHAFCIYAAAANYQHTHNPRALDLAKRAFQWMDAHAHDPANGGYIEAVDRAGKPLVVVPTADGALTRDALNTPIGQKSMNTHIHILEALAGLYDVWPDPRLRARLEEVFLIVRDKIATRPGHLHLYFQKEWTPAPRAISFGHDVETGFLLVEAATMLGQPDDAKTWEVARMLVDTPLANGWDADNGGFYDESDLNGKLTRADKIWWVQAEGLNALLLMHERYARETARYWDAFLKQWAFIQRHQVDHRYGGWFSRVAPSGAIQPGLVKSNRWTEGYHQGRALMRVADRLRRLSGMERG